MKVDTPETPPKDLLYYSKKDYKWRLGCKF